MKQVMARREDDFNDFLRADGDDSDAEAEQSNYVWDITAVSSASDGHSNLQPRVYVEVWSPAFISDRHTSPYSHTLAFVDSSHKMIRDGIVILTGSLEYTLNADSFE